MTTGGRGISTAGASSVLPLTTGSATANVKGAWTVIITNTGQPLMGVFVYSGANVGNSASNNQVLFDIGIAPVGAAAGTETVLFANLPLGHMNQYVGAFMPIKVPAGYRISARCQGSSASFGIRIGVTTVPAGGSMSVQEGCDRTATLGADTATSAGTSMTLPSAINTKGPWTVLSASTPFAARHIAFCCSGVNTATAVANTQMLADIGFGPAGAELVLFGDLPMAESASETYNGIYVSLPCNIPAGSRIVARYTANTSVAALSNPCALAVIFG